MVLHYYDSKTRRNESCKAKFSKTFLGICLLSLAANIWSSAGYSNLISKGFKVDLKFDKPFFCTYMKAALYTGFLFGLLIFPPWRNDYCSRPTAYYNYLDNDSDEDVIDSESPVGLSSPVFVPVKEPTIVNETWNSKSAPAARSVRFNRVAEVRQLSEKEAADALLARLSYNASLYANALAKQAATKLPLGQVVKVAFMFSFLSFTDNYATMLAYFKFGKQAADIIFSTSSFFTLALLGLCSGGKVAISKLVAASLTLLGVFLMVLPDIKFDWQLSLGTALSLLVAFLNALYLVCLRRAVNQSEAMDIPVFLGFVGLFNVLFFWPAFPILHKLGVESFIWPSDAQVTSLFFYLLTFVTAETSWLWGSQLTSPLFANTLLTLLIPISKLMDIATKNGSYSNLFYYESIPVVVGFSIMLICTFFDQWDPILSLTRRLTNKFKAEQGFKGAKSEEELFLTDIANEIE